MVQWVGRHCQQACCSELARVRIIIYNWWFDQKISIISICVVRSLTWKTHHFKPSNSQHEYHRNNRVSLTSHLHLLWFTNFRFDRSGRGGVFTVIKFPLVKQSQVMTTESSKGKWQFVFFNKPTSQKRGISSCNLSRDKCNHGHWLHSKSTPQNIVWKSKHSPS